MRLALVLLLIVFGMNYTADPIATMYAKQLAAAKAWDFILMGIGSAALMLLIGILSGKRVVWPVCLWGMVEGGERAVCRLAHPIGEGPPPTELFSGLCGTEAYWLGVVAALWLALTWLDKKRGDKDGMGG